MSETAAQQTYAEMRKEVIEASEKRAINQRLERIDKMLGLGFLAVPVKEFIGGLRIDASIAKWRIEQAKLSLMGWPPALIKASEDPFFYALELRDGRKFDFESAVDLGWGWVRIDGVAKAERCFERGIDIRVSEILWVADAPDGS